MSTEIAVALIAFALLVVGAITYVVVRLWREPPAQGLCEQSQRLSRFAGFPKLFDSLLAKSLTNREKLGWLLFFVIAVLAIILTGKPK